MAVAGHGHACARFRSMEFVLKDGSGQAAQWARRPRNMLLINKTSLMSDVNGGKSRLVAAGPPGCNRNRGAEGPQMR
jgi:hypothetical protein